MKSLRLLTAVAIGLAALASAVAPTSAATATSLSLLPGTWNCTTQGSMGPSTGTVTFTQVLPNLVQLHWKDSTGKTAGLEGTGEWFYDSKKGEYVSFGAGSYGWGVSQGAGSADATTITLKDTYPNDPSNGTTTYHLSSSSIGFTSDWMQNGKAMHIEQTCTKA